MAGVSYLHLPGEDEDDRADGDGDVLVSFDSFPYWSQDFAGFDVYTSDLDFPPSDFRISSGRQQLPRQSPSRGFTGNFPGNELIRNLDLFDRGNQVNFVMDLFHQRVEQSSLGSNSLDLDLDLGLGLPGSRDMESNNVEVNLDLGLGFGGGVDRNDDEINGVSGFMIADFSDDLTLSRRNGIISDSGGLSGLQVVDIESDSDDAGAIEEGFDEENVYDDDDDASLRACWAAFQLADDAYNRRDVNEDFEWEEVGVQIDEREVVDMFLDRETEDDQRVSELEWEVLLNVYNSENSESGHVGDLFDTEFDMLFGQFADNISRPPASKVAVENLLSVAITQDDVEKNNALCAVCKDEIYVGQIVKQLPCVHRYHGECIVPWLGIRNTCPVCRYELPTDDPDYERRRAERAGRTN